MLLCEIYYLNLYTVPLLFLCYFIYLHIIWHKISNVTLVMFAQKAKLTYITGIILCLPRNSEKEPYFILILHFYRNSLSQMIHYIWDLTAQWTNKHTKKEVQMGGPPLLGPSWKLIGMWLTKPHNACVFKLTLLYYY